MTKKFSKALLKKINSLEAQLNVVHAQRRKIEEFRQSVEAEINAMRKYVGKPADYVAVCRNREDASSLRMDALRCYGKVLLKDHGTGVVPMETPP